ncbi:hypothetical protein [Microbacterium sp. 1P10AE]|uniref:hypothetical protein n=1 Tax=Microbacterium sp. 1P10AE TaxID=3132286 RepID=UPI0039A0B6BF
MNDELTPDERAALRSRILGGARDIKPAGAHRNAWIAGSIAAVLVVAIAGGVVATSTLSAPQIAETPTPTPVTTETVPPSPTPPPTSVPTPAATAVTAVGRAPFGDSCDNVLTSEQLAAATGHPMYDVTFIRHDTRATVRGGVFCAWVSSDERWAATVNVAVLPSTESLPAPESDQFATEGCDENGRCTLTRVEDGVRVWVQVWAKLTTQSPDVTATRSSTLLDQIFARAGDYPAGVTATPTSAWWSPWDCVDVTSWIDPTVSGYDTATSVTAEPDTAKADGACTITLSRPTSTWDAQVWLVPGGAVGLDQMVAAADRSTPVTVSGAVEAYSVTVLAKVDDGGASFLWVSDGTNLLVVTPSSLEEPDVAIQLAEQLLARL